MKHLTLSILILYFSLLCLWVSAQTKPQLKGTDASSTGYLDLVQENRPQFPGGPEEFLKFINKNLRLPNGEIEAEGRVLVSFDVEKDGRTTNFRVIKGLHPAYDQEALIMLRKMPKWKPGMRFGRPIKVKCTVIVKFISPGE